VLRGPPKAVHNAVVQGRAVAPDAIAARRSPADLRRLADRGRQALEGATAQEIVGWAAEHFDGSVFATQSMTNTALASMIAEVAPQIPIVFVDTGMHFQETIGLRDDLARRYAGLSLTTVQSPLSLADQEQQFGSDLWHRDPDLCCLLRKVKPVESLWASNEAWLTGLRRFAGRRTSRARIVEFDEVRGVVKICPLLDWSDGDLASYTRINQVLVSPLVEAGYPSVGCHPCTRTAIPGAGSRSGRWFGFAKTECGLHTAD
jgi:phosphoadenosine phosphosulfate reductase